jgi:hypothetical protein
MYGCPSAGLPAVEHSPLAAAMIAALQLGHAHTAAATSLVAVYTAVGGTWPVQ